MKKRARVAIECSGRTKPCCLSLKSDQSEFYLKKEIVQMYTLVATLTHGQERRHVHRISWCLLGYVTIKMGISLSYWVFSLTFSSQTRWKVIRKKLLILCLEKSIQGFLWNTNTREHIEDRLVIIIIQDRLKIKQLIILALLLNSMSSQYWLSFFEPNCLMSSLVHLPWNGF